MTSTKSRNESARRFSLANVVLGILVVAVLTIAGYLTYRLLSIHEEDIVIEQVSTEQDTVIDLNTPRPTQDEILNWTVPSDHPRYMSIEAIGLGKTRVEAVGRNTKNAIDIPINIWNTAWFKESALPGAPGAGLYDCHTFFGVGTGVCDNLKNLKNGDEIVIERGDGIKYTYSTVEIRDLSLPDANAYVSTLLTVPEGYSTTQSISIITCAGNFDMKTQTSDRRLTVRAILVR